MTKENVIKLYKHFCYLAEGNFAERDFDVEFPAGTSQADDDGYSRMGKFTPERRLLIISDAKRHKEEMENKKDKAGNLLYPYLKDEAPKKKVKSEEKTE